MCYLVKKQNSDSVLFTALGVCDRVLIGVSTFDDVILITGYLIGLSCKRRIENKKELNKEKKR